MPNAPSPQEIARDLVVALFANDKTAPVGGSNAQYVGEFVGSIYKIVVKAVAESYHRKA